MSALFAFLHHIGAFTLVSALAIELVMIRSDLTVANARRLLFADSVFGASAGILLVVGLLRVFFLEKGAGYYFHSVPFIIKLLMFVAVGLLSIYPTRQFLSWRPSLQGGAAPAVDAAKLQTVRRIVHLELAGVVIIILCAVLMARGIGYVGA